MIKVRRKKPPHLQHIGLLPDRLSSGRPHFALMVSEGINSNKSTEIVNHTYTRIARLDYY